MGYYGGKPLVLKVGKYLLLNQRDLDRTVEFFQRRSGLWTVFACRFIPVVRHFISIPAGMGKMPWWPFMFVTLVGATLWNSFLLFCGYKLRTHWKTILGYTHYLDYLMVLGIVICRIQPLNTVARFASGRVFFVGHEEF